MTGFETLTTLVIGVSYVSGLLANILALLLAVVGLNYRNSRMPASILILVLVAAWRLPDFVPPLFPNMPRFELIAAFWFLSFILGCLALIGIAKNEHLKGYVKFPILCGFLSFSCLGLAMVITGSSADMDASGVPYLDQFIHGRAEGPIEAVR